MSFATFSILDIVALLVAGLFAGAINAVAGGGTFFSFGAMTLIGFPPITANATSSIAMFPGYLSSALAYRQEIAAMKARIIPMLIVSFAGSLVGALVLLSLDNPTFRSLVPWLLIAATALFAAGPFLTRYSGTQHGSKPRFLTLPIQFATSVYGGFFGAGMGLMMLAALGLTESDDYHQINAIKNALSIVIGGVAIAVFSLGGIIAWEAGLTMVLAVTLGGWYGVVIARRLPQSVIRAFVIAVGLGLTIYYFLTG